MEVQAEAERLISSILIGLMLFWKQLDFSPKNLRYLIELSGAKLAASPPKADTDSKQFA